MAAWQAHAIAEMGSIALGAGVFAPGPVLAECALEPLPRPWILRIRSLGVRDGLVVLFDHVEEC